jgi:hypothetical protein
VARWLRDLIVAAALVLSAPFPWRIRELRCDRHLSAHKTARTAPFLWDLRIRQGQVQVRRSMDSGHKAEPKQSSLGATTGLLRRGSARIARMAAIWANNNQNGGGSGFFGLGPKARAVSR